MCVRRMLLIWPGGSLLFDRFDECRKLASYLQSKRQEAIATLVRVPLVTRQAAMGVAVFGEGEGGESGGAGYAGVRVAAPGNGGC